MCLLCMNIVKLGPITSYFFFNYFSTINITIFFARTLIGGCIFIYSGSARLASFEINFISKETSRAEHEYMNIHPPSPINALATALLLNSLVAA